MRRSVAAIALAVWAIACVPTAPAAVVPHPLFTDNAVLQRDMKVPVWGKADPGEKVTVKIGEQEASAEADKDGKWMVRLNPMKAGGPVELTIAGKDSKVVLKNVLIGEVWVCSGQSNMWWPIRLSAEPKKTAQEAKYPGIHLFTVPQKTSKTPLAEVKGAWSECTPESADNFSAVAYHFGKYLHKELGVPVGLIHTSWGGTICEAWASKPALETHADFKEVDKALEGFEERYVKNLAKYKDDMVKYKEMVEKAKSEGKTPPKAPVAPRKPEEDPNRPSVLYNAMIAPIIPYGIRGAIWYQGESNAGRAHQYRTLFPLMIKNWRDDWKQGEFPFLFVQLAPFMKIEKEPKESNWAELREAQMLTAKALPRAGMAVITDVGDEKDIHPKQKEPVGVRLGLAARALAYGQKIEYSGPVYDSMKVDGDKVVLSFKHVGGGLVAKGGTLTGFSIASEDKKFVNAEAKIEGDKVIVSASGVTKPVAVRYGWANYPVVNLENKEGIPASPFRTDDFPMLTGPKTKK
jgi:sialate O-acetylesterase